jgi:uncharacterized protein YggE
MCKNHWITATLLGLFVCLLAWIVSGAQPQAVIASTPEAAGSITVSGSSAILVQPDRAVIVLGVETFAETPSQAHSLNTERMARVRAALRAAGIAEKEIATAHFTLYPEHEGWAKHELVSGYYACNAIAVTVHDVASVEGVLVLALEAGATSVQGIEFSVSNLRDLRDEARALAVEAAMEKAADMAAVAHMETGYVTDIQEGYLGFYGGYSRNWTASQNVVQDLGGESAVLLEDGSISLGQITVRAEVSMSVELRPAGLP